MPTKKSTLINVGALMALKHCAFGTASTIFALITLALAAVRARQALEAAERVAAPLVPAGKDGG